MGIIHPKKLEEGVVLNSWFNSRFKRNQNVLLAVTGKTGSSKSYDCVTICQNWYKFKFKEDFPVKTHCCFSIAEVMKLLSSGKLRKGELIILEEAGTSMNALDFQNRISKLFTFILQSFRSMNIGLIMNLPVLSMLNKSARLLLHAHFITCGIDYEKKIAKVKPFFHQLNQQTGKIYPKYLRIKYQGKTKVVKRFNFSIPPKELINEYEIKKVKFVNDLTQSFSNELDEIQRKEERKMGRKELSEVRLEVLTLLQEGKTPKEIAEIRGVTVRTIYRAIKSIKKLGYTTKIKENPKKID